MTTEQPNRPPFKVAGAATIKHLNVRKEGPEDEKILAVDIKLEVRGIDRRLCAYFDDALEAFLWRGDTDALIVRNDYLEPVKYAHSISSATASIAGQSFVGCDVGKFAISPRDGGVIDLVMCVTAYPSSDEVAQLAKRVQDDTQIEIEGPPDLFAATSAPKAEPVESVQAEVIKAAAKLPDSLVELAISLVKAPGGKASISYLQCTMRIGYNQAARVMEILEQNGIVGPMQANGQRKVLA